MVHSIVENIDCFSQNLLTELHGLVEMFHPSEQKYHLKIQKVQGVMQMITLKFQSLDVFYKAEVNDLGDQLKNREDHIKLLEEALQEISSSFREVVQSREREWNSRCFRSDSSSDIGSVFSSLSEDSGSGDDSLHISRVVRSAGEHKFPRKWSRNGTMNGAVVKKGVNADWGNSSDFGGGGVAKSIRRSKSRIPRLKHLSGKENKEKTGMSLSHSHHPLSSAASLAKETEVRQRVRKLNQKIAEAQILSSSTFRTPGMKSLCASCSSRGGRSQNHSGPSGTADDDDNSCSLTHSNSTANELNTTYLWNKPPLINHRGNDQAKYDY